MKQRATTYILALVLVLLAVAGGTAYFMKLKAGKPNPPAARTEAASKTPAQETTIPSVPPGLVENTANFLGSLTPGGNADSAGRERTYIVSYQEAFVRKAPTEKAPEESMSYQELQQRGDEKMPPYLYYGESVLVLLR